MESKTITHRNPNIGGALRSAGPGSTPNAAYPTQILGGSGVLLVLFSLLAAGCASTPYQAPVQDATVDATPTGAQAGTEQAGVYIVQKGDTLYSIALNHGLDRKEFAEWNNIPDGGTIHIGQQLSLSPPSPQAGPSLFSLPESSPPSAPGVTQGPAVPPEAKVLANTERFKTEPKAFKLPYSEQAVAQLKGVPDGPRTVLAKVDPMAEKQVTPILPPAADSPSEVISEPDRLDWSWPAKGRLLEAFSEASKGIDIVGKAGEPVTASAAGKVVYSGAGLRGYGKLIIIKHNNTYLSAYAHNSKILVKEGQAVAKGQKIGEMGSTDTGLVKLHFEIRKNGRPVDPLKHLPGISG
jgi:lipoprotein NlpD